jgi:tetratricopeptide (TPR) repeat protein
MKCFNFSVERYLRAAGDLLAIDGDFESALALVNKTLTIDPTDLRALILKGDILYSLDRDQEALEAFKTALVVDPACSEALIFGAAILDIFGHYRQALLFCERALQLKISDSYLVATLYDQYVSLLLHVKKYAQAKLFLKQSRYVLDTEEYHYLMGSYTPLVEKGLAIRQSNARRKKGSKKILSLLIE